MWRLPKSARLRKSFNEKRGGEIESHHPAFLFDNLPLPGVLGYRRCGSQPHVPGRHERLPVTKRPYVNFITLKYS
jgi:hypothetical protein